MLGGGSRLERGLVYARAAMLPFFWIGAAVVFLWSLRATGPLAAALATAFYTTAPPILAHAGLVTRDMALTAMLGAAALASIYRVENPTRRMTLIFGAAVGFAVITKFSAIVFLPSVWLVMLACRFCSRCENPLREFSSLRRYVAPAAGSLATAAFVIRAAYRFDIGRLSGAPYTLPAPEFFGGIRDLWQHNL